MNIPEQFSVYFPVPWMGDNYGNIFDASGMFVFSECSNDVHDFIRNVRLSALLMKALNGETVESGGTWSYEGTVTDSIISVDGNPLFDVRGWGRLTSHMDDNDVVKLQDDLGEWIVNLMNSQRKTC